MDNDSLLYDSYGGKCLSILTSHATALNNTLRQVSGAVSVTMLIVISSIPHSFVLGMRISMWVTVVLVLLMLVVFISYIKNRNSRR